MKAKGLVSVWSAPDNSRLTAKQSSFRLPVHVAARINALCDLYPSKTKTQIVADLLAAALSEIEYEIPAFAGEYVDKHPDTNEKMFKEAGDRARFRQATNTHYAELERELGNETPGLFFSSNYMVSEDEK